MRFLARVETKVWAALVGTGAGATIAAGTLWALGVFVWGVAGDADHAQAAIDAVPVPVAGMVGLLVTVLGTFVGGWSAPPSNHAGNDGA